jgi:hypothetical protein
MIIAKNLRQQLCHKNDDDNICDFEESKGLIYYKGFVYVPPWPT